MNIDQSLIDINKDPKDTKIVVAMSGGVDSSVVAVMLKKLGYQVIGITLQLYDHGEILKKKNACCAGTDIYDAKKVAQQHDFPHYTLNYQNNFKERVIDDFVNSYLEGATPIPCVKCNQSVKFGDLLKLAKDLEADAMATGHYVQRKINQFQKPELHKASDLTKDQSYFLFNTTNEQLDFLRFPLGGFNKEYTRKLAIEFGLEIANKPDSQDICFVPNNDYAQVIKKYRPDSFKIGEIIHIKTHEVLGKHQGIVNFTIGQRRGLKIAYPNPLYVIKLDAKNNQVFVGEEDLLNQQIFYINDCNWLIDINNPQNAFQNYNTSVRIRSSGEDNLATIEILPNNQAKITMKSMIKSISKGQAGVVYSNTKILGGGWII